MPLVRHVFAVAVPAREAGQRPHGFAIAPCDANRDFGCLTDLTAGEPAAGHPGEPRLTAVGLARELQGRPDRQVHAWLARSSEPAVDTASCLGLIALVEAGHGQACRFSISWLLVSPHARRRGVGTALVDHAVRMAATLGATHVFVETRADWPAARAFWNAVASR